MYLCISKKDKEMKWKTARLLLLALLAPVWATAQSTAPTACYTDQDGNLKETTAIDDGQAPLTVTFRANPSDVGQWTGAYEWHFRKVDTEGNTRELLVRYEENTEYVFNESGTFHIVFKPTFVNGNDTIAQDSTTLTVTISESRLEFPNAFSPNGDGKNEIYGAKGINDENSTSHYRSIVAFHAYIFNRWGQKLFEWTDVSKGWDGTYRGKPVKEGVYYVLVKARGADGKEYNIRRDVNLLRGYREGSSTATTE